LTEKTIINRQKTLIHREKTIINKIPTVSNEHQALLFFLPCTGVASNLERSEKGDLLVHFVAGLHAPHTDGAVSGCRDEKGPMGIDGQRADRLAVAHKHHLDTPHIVPHLDCNTKTPP